MQLKNQVKLDRLLGIFIAFPLNLLVRLLGLFTRFDHRLEGPFKRITVAKYKGMGSIIQASPLLREIKKTYPSCELIFVTTPGNKVVLEQWEFVDKVLIIDDSKFLKLLGSTLRLILFNWRNRSDVFIDLETYSNFSSVITTISLARDRLGFYLSSNSFKMGMYTHMMYFNLRIPIVDVYLQFARLLNCPVSSKELAGFKLHNNAILSEKYIVINVNASDLRIERRWPLANFKQLIHKILEESNLDILLIGSKNEAVYVEQIAKDFRTEKRVLDLSGKTTFSELIQVISNAEFMITNDTGPMHISAAQGKRTIALFGPCHPQQYGNHGNIEPVYKNVYCSPCVHEFSTPPCKGNNQCMQLISVQDVLDAIKNNKSSSDIHFKGVHNKTLGNVILGQYDRQIHAKTY